MLSLICIHVYLVGLHDTGGSNSWDSIRKEPNLFFFVLFQSANKMLQPNMCWSELVCFLCCLCVSVQTKIFNNLQTLVWKNNCVCFSSISWLSVDLLSNALSVIVLFLTERRLTDMFIRRKRNLHDISSSEAAGKTETEDEEDVDSFYLLCFQSSVQKFILDFKVHEHKITLLQCEEGLSPALICCL